jgi:hypothetical protein
VDEVIDKPGVDFELVRDWKPEPQQGYVEPYPIDIDTFADETNAKLKSLEQRIYIVGAGVLVAGALAALQGRLVLKLAQGQAQLVRAFNDLALGLGMGVGHLDDIVPQNSEVETEEGVQEDSVIDESKLVVTDSDVVKPKEIGSPKTETIDIPRVDGREPFRREE